MSVTRWAWSGVYENPMIRWEHGEYVLYEDHIKEMEQYKCTIDVLEQTRRERDAACAERDALREELRRTQEDYRVAREAHDARMIERTALAARVERLEGAFNAGHHALIDQALKGAATALPVLFTMCTKLGFREGATVADEINANVLTAIKQFGHICAALSPQAEKLEKEGV